MCGELSSYSDACSTVVLTYNNEIYTAIANGFTKRNICMLSGMCSEAFHPHTNGYNVRILDLKKKRLFLIRYVLFCRRLRML